MFGRATIRLGIGPHSSCEFFINISKSTEASASSSGICAHCLRFARSVQVQQYLAFLFLFVDFEFEKQRGELSDVDEAVVAAAGRDEELGLLVSHPVTLEFLRSLGHVQFAASVLVQRLELLHHLFSAAANNTEKLVPCGD